SNLTVCASRRPSVDLLTVASASCSSTTIKRAINPTPMRATPRLFFRSRFNTARTLKRSAVRFAVTAPVMRLGRLVVRLMFWPNARARLDEKRRVKKRLDKFSCVATVRSQPKESRATLARAPSVFSFPDRAQNETPAVGFGERFKDRSTGTVQTVAADR